MSNATALVDADPGYLSSESKRRFTLIAGVLGILFFVAQFFLPMLVMFGVMITTFKMDMKSLDLGHADILRDEVWVIESTHTLNWRHPEDSSTTLALTHVRLADLKDGGPSFPLGHAWTDSRPSVLAQGARLSTRLRCWCRAG